ncbi:MAG: outer membrane protein assembly factor BamB family protein [Planctomycetota bacterium]|jgi:outer membrane protein assembly factor BamB
MPLEKMEKLEGPLTLDLLDDIFTRLQQREIVANIIITDGESERVVYVSVGALRMLLLGRRRGLRFGEFLVEAKMVTRDDVNVALEDQQNPDKPPRLLGEILVEMRKVEEKQVTRVLSAQVKREFLDCFTWSDAIVRMDAEDPSPKLFDPERPVIKYSDNLPKFFTGLSEAMAEHREVRSTFRTVHDVPRIEEEWRKDEIARKYKGMTRRILELIDGKSTVADIAKAARITEHECMVALYRRTVTGEVAIDWARDPATVRRERQAVADECRRIERAVEFMVEDRVARQRLALNYEYLGKHDKAAEQWSILIDREVSHGRVDNALAALAKKVKIHPEDFEAHEKRVLVAYRAKRLELAVKFGVELAGLYARQGFIKRASDLYGKIIEWAPSNIDARKGYAELARDTGDRETALDHLRAVAAQLEKKGAREILEPVYEDILKLDNADAAARSFMRIRAKEAQSWLMRRGPLVLCLLLILISGGIVILDIRARIELQTAVAESRARFYARIEEITRPIDDFRSKIQYRYTRAFSHARRLKRELQWMRGRAFEAELADLYWRARYRALPAGDVMSAKRHLNRIISIGGISGYVQKAEDELVRIRDIEGKVRGKWKLEVDDVLSRQPFDPTDPERGEEAYSNARRILRESPRWALPPDSYIPRFVMSDPPGATIFLNGKALSLTPRIIEMPSDNSSQLVLSLKGGYENAALTIGPDASFEISVSLGRPVRWRVSLDACVTTPITVYEGVAYAATEDGQVVAVDAGTGMLKWAVRPRQSDGSILFSGLAYAPAVSARHVVATTVKNGAFVLNRETGKQEHRISPSDTLQEISAQPVFSGDGSLFFLTGDDGILFTFETTRFQPRGGYLDLGATVLGTPVCDGTNLILMTTAAECIIVDVDVNTIVKTIELEAPVAYGPINLRDRLLAISHRGRSSILYTVRLVQTELREPGVIEAVSISGAEGRLSFEPTFVPNALYVPSTSGKIAAMGVGGPRVDELWVASLGAGPVSLIAVADSENRCYAVNGQGRLYSLDRTNGNVLWSTISPAQFVSPPTTLSEGVLVCGEDGVLHLIEH